MYYFWAESSSSTAHRQQEFNFRVSRFWSHGDLHHQRTSFLLKIMCRLILYKSLEPAIYERKSKTAIHNSHHSWAGPILRWGKVNAPAMLIFMDKIVKTRPRVPISSHCHLKCHLYQELVIHKALLWIKGG